jgi:DNA polymerase III psi subunit
MTEARRRAYLEAMGFDVWLQRPPAAERDRLIVGPGGGSTLMVCAQAEETSGKLAGDIVRAIGGDPTWAWPESEGDAAGVRLPDAVEERLFTRIVIFGQPLANRLLGGDPPATLSSAVIGVAPGLAELADSPAAKRAFWKLLCGGP